MRDIIEKQLRQSSFADLSHFDANTNTYHIPKYSKPVYEMNKCYLVQIPKYLVNNEQSLPAINWNNGKSPMAEFMKIYVSKTLGKMIYVDGLVYNNVTGEDTSDMWSGWLPSDELTQLQVLN